MQTEALSSDMAELLRRAAEPIRPGELVCEQIRRAARVCGLSYSRARKLWYRECKVSGLDFVAITSAMARFNDNLIAYQAAKAALLRDQLAEARTRT